MRRFVNYYHFYLRVVTYGLPFLSFGAARYLLRSVGHPDTGLDRYSYFNLLLFMTVIWAIVSEYYRVTSVQELFRERTGIRAAFSTCAAAYAVLLGVLFFFHRSEEHTSELQSRFDLVCRLLLEKKKKKIFTY